MNCKQNMEGVTGWKSWLPPNPFACEFCGYYVASCLSLLAILISVVLACMGRL